MKVTALLCDYAIVADGKLYISGGGWNVTAAQTSPAAIALLFEVPWNRANEKIKFEIKLLSADDDQITQPGPLGEIPARIAAEIEVGRPAGLKQGSELNAPFAFAIPVLKLEPDTRYVWVIEVERGEPAKLHLPFATRPNS